MQQKFYEPEINRIADCAKSVARDVHQSLLATDMSNVIIGVGETHYELAQCYFQVSLFKEAQKLFAYQNSFEMVEKTMFPHGIPAKVVWNQKFSTAVKYLHNHCTQDYHMAPCLAPAYVISQVNSSILCSDIDLGEEMTLSILSERENKMSEGLFQLQNQTRQPIFHVGGEDHLIEFSYLERPTLLDKLLTTKKMIAVHLIEANDWGDHLKIQSQKIESMSSTLKDNILTDISVKLPPTQVIGSSKVFNYWDKIVLANQTPEFLLSSRNRNAYKHMT